MRFSWTIHHMFENRAIELVTVRPVAAGWTLRSGLEPSLVGIPTMDRPRYLPGLPSPKLGKNWARRGSLSARRTLTEPNRSSEYRRRAL